MSVLIIAEAGVNHNGSLELAKKMALVAKECGADVVKYQTAVPELVISKFAQKAEYQKRETGAEESQLEMVRRIHFGFEAHKELKEYCDSIGIQYLSAPFDLPSVEFLAGLDLPMCKVPSGEITNLPYLEAVGRTKKPVILSTGMSTLPEIEDALSISDHTSGWECDVAAVALGATVIEKHFTLDKTMEGPDHKASLEPAELKAMVQAVRHTEAALGTGRKAVSASEAKNKPIARKSIVAARAIKAGETFTAENLTTKRPGDGISPMRWYEVLGKTAGRDFEEDEKIEL